MGRPKKIVGDERGDVKVLKDVRPSDNLVKREMPEGLLEKRVTQKEVMELQDPRNGQSGMIGFRPHRVNEIVPVIAETNEVIPDSDGTVGVALFDPKLMTEEQIDALKAQKEDKK